MTEKKMKKRAVSVPVILLSVLLVIVLGVVGFLAYNVLTDPYDCRIAPGVTIGAVDVSGMSKKEAREALTNALNESLYANALVVKLPEEELNLTSELLSAKVDIHDAVNAAYGFGRDEEALEQSIPLLPYLTVNEAAIRGTLEEYAAKWNTELTQPVWELAGEEPRLSTADYDPEAQGQQLLLTKGVPALHLDVAQIYGDILVACNEAVTLCGENRFLVSPEVQPEALPEVLDLEAIHKEVTIAPVNDSLNMETYGFVHGTYGYSFDLEAAEKQLNEAAAGETLAIPMTITEPEILGDGVYFRDVLGHCETKHTDDENRNTNLRLLCEALDGVILQPGDVFSYNEVVGERTEEKGYKPATAYSGTRLVKDIGGGVCQGSTTIYNCALLADLEILERVCHGATVGYITLGLDAAVNWNTKTDLKFKNNFNFPMMIKAEVSEGYVRMQILGTDEKDYYIEMRCGFGEEGAVKYAVSYKCKYDKETGEQISKEREAFSTYYPLG